MEVGEPFDGIGESLFIEMGVFALRCACTWFAENPINRVLMLKTGSGLERWAIR